MPVGLRTAVLGALSPVAVAALALGSSLPASAAVPPAPNPNCSVVNKCTALLLGGTGTGTLTESEMREALDGYFADDNVYTRQNVAYPGSWDFLPSIAIGASLLVGEITSTEGPMVVGGFSQGAVVADQAMFNLSINPKAPPKEELRFILVADPNYSPSAPKWMVPETKYDVIAITQEYDGFADKPDRWWNPIAVYNATLGGLYLHFQTIDADLSTVPAENITVTVNSKGGVTTHYLVPTETLPLVKFLPFLAPLEPWLKEQVNAGYSRYDDIAPTADASLRSVAFDVESTEGVQDATATETPAIEAVADASDLGDDESTDNSIDVADSDADTGDAGDQEGATPLGADLDESGEGANAEGEAEVEDADVADEDGDVDAVDAAEAEPPAHRLHAGSDKSTTVGAIQKRVSSESETQSADAGDTDSAESPDGGSDGDS